MMLPLPPEFQFDRGSVFLAPPAPALTLTGNDIDCVPLPSSPAASGSSFALAIFDDAANPLKASDTTVTIASNHLKASVPTIYPTLFAALSGNLAMTGNHVINKALQADPRSLWVDSTFDPSGKPKPLGLAVTGNVFHGLTNLTHLTRPGNFTAPLDTWEVSNATLPH